MAKIKLSTSGAVSILLTCWDVQVVPAVLGTVSTGIVESQLLNWDSLRQSRTTLVRGPACGGEFD